MNYRPWIISEIPIGQVVTFKTNSDLKLLITGRAYKEGRAFAYLNGIPTETKGLLEFWTLNDGEPCGLPPYEEIPNKHLTLDEYTDAKIDSIYDFRTMMGKVWLSNQIHTKEQWDTKFNNYMKSR